MVGEYAAADDLSAAAFCCSDTLCGVLKNGFIHALGIDQILQPNQIIDLHVSFFRPPEQSFLRRANCFAVMILRSSKSCNWSKPRFL